MRTNNRDLIVIGGGLAGCEAALQAAKRGINVTLYEMRPSVSTPAHKTPSLGELVCSNSLGSLLPDRASGLLMSELRKLNSFLLKIAEESCVPSGSSLSVDRDVFSAGIEQAIRQSTHIKVIREEVTEMPLEPAVIATGPLTSPALSSALMDFTGQKNFYFYDAVSPVIYLDSIDFSKAFCASRFAEEKGQTADYINCPMNKNEFELFASELASAKRSKLKEFESEIEIGIPERKKDYFEACLPVEIIASRGFQSLAFGPMRPIGLKDPRTDLRPYAVLQLRQENRSATLYNMVGFQTNLTYSEQKRVFRLIPGLENAEFARFGQMHRNTYLNSPDLLQSTSQLKNRTDLFLAGQLTGIEGYLGNIASGLLAGINASNYLLNKELCIFPPSTMIGALYNYITENHPKSFQPMKANFGLLPELVDRFVPRPERAARYVDAAARNMDQYLQENLDILGIL